MPEVDHLDFGLKTSEEGPVVDGGVGDGADLDLGTHPPDMRDLACELRLQRALAALGYTGKIDSLQALTVSVVEGDRTATFRLKRRNDVLFQITQRV